MEKLETFLKRHNVEWTIILFLKANVPDYNNISINEFFKSYNVRQMLGWRKVGNKTLLKLAEIFDKEGLSLRY